MNKSSSIYFNRGTWPLHFSHFSHEEIISLSTCICWYFMKPYWIIIFYYQLMQIWFQITPKLWRGVMFEFGPHSSRIFNFFRIKKQTTWKTKNKMNCDNMEWKMWYEEDLECIMKRTEIQWISVRFLIYSDTLWDTTNNELSRQTGRGWRIWN